MTSEWCERVRDLAGSDWLSLPTSRAENDLSNLIPDPNTVIPGPEVTSTLVDLALNQLASAGDAAAIFAAIGQVDALIEQAFQQRLPPVDLISCAAAIGEGDRPHMLSTCRHSQISDVQSPPG